MGFRGMAFAHAGIGRTSGRIEIPQGDVLQTIRASVILKYLLNCQLAAAIRINRQLRMPLIDRGMERLAVRRAGAGKDYFFNSESLHDIQQIDRANHIIGIVFCRIGHAFANVSECGKMDNGINMIRCKQCLQGKYVQQIRMTKPGPGINRLAMPINQIIRHNHLAAAIKQMLCRMRADVPGSSHYQNHNFLLKLPFCIQQWVLINREGAL